MMLESNHELFNEVVPPSNSHEQCVTPFNFIDLFAGIGGFHSALSSIGGKCVFASEKDLHARTTYLANHDISEDFFNDDIRKIAPDNVPDHDILCAGFPCQPFSQAGNKKGFSDGENSERGNLFYCILDIIEAKRPRAFILENVRHLIAHDEGKTFKIILDYLENANYSVSYKVIKASDFNVPQNRPRVFIVGFDRSQVDLKSTFHFPIPVRLIKTMSDIFGAPCEKKIGFTLRVGGKGSPIEDRRNYEFYRVKGEIKRIDLDQARELMSFPNNFKFPVSKTQAMKQLGNSVCVEVVKVVSQSVIEFLNKNTKEQKDEAVKNKGEMSEIYVLLKIIHQKIIQYGDSIGMPTRDLIRVLKIKNTTTDIFLNEVDVEIVEKNGEKTLVPINKIITDSELKEIVQAIREGGSPFGIAKIDTAIRLPFIQKTKGTSKEKADITLDFKDGVLYESQGISIKSFLGGSPTLLNASSATNFIYEINGLPKKIIDEINSIDSQSKIKDRVAAIISSGAVFQFIKCENSVYEANLRKADSLMPELLADALLAYYLRRFQRKIVDYLPPDTKFPALSSDTVHCRLRDFIKYTMFGIFPASHWDGNITANGALLVKTDGEMVFYHTNKENTLKDYFYRNTFFDTPSSTRHRFGSLYREDGKIKFKLNLQLRLE